MSATYLVVQRSMTYFNKIRYRVANFWLWRTFSRSRYTIELSFMVKMRRRVPQSANVGLPSFVKAQQALKTTPGQDANLMLSAKKAVTLWKI